MPLNVFYTYRNDDNFTPLHLLNKNSGEELDLLDPDHLLPRANDPVLQENIIEVCVRISIKVRHTFLLDVLLFLQKIKKGDLKRFLKWLNGKKGRVNCYRGGLATEGGLVVEGGTALHWAAYYGQRDIVDALIRGKAGLIIVKNNSRCNENIPDQHSTNFYPHICALHLICG